MMTIDRNAQQRIHQLETEMRELKQCIRDLMMVLQSSDSQISDDSLVTIHYHKLFDDDDRSRLMDILMKLG